MSPYNPLALGWGWVRGGSVVTNYFSELSSCDPQMANGLGRKRAKLSAATGPHVSFQLPETWLVQVDPRGSG